MAKKYEQFDSRIMVPVTKEQFDKLNKLIPWGYKYHVFQVLVLGLIATLEEDTTGSIISAIISNVTKSNVFIEKGLEKYGKS